jgi:hypothetical protein
MMLLEDGAEEITVIMKYLANVTQLAEPDLALRQAADYLCGFSCMYVHGPKITNPQPQLRSKN